MLNILTSFPTHAHFFTMTDGRPFASRNAVTCPKVSTLQYTSMALPTMGCPVRRGWRRPWEKSSIELKLLVTLLPHLFHYCMFLTSGILAKWPKFPLHSEGSLLLWTRVQAVDLTRHPAPLLAGVIDVLKYTGQ